MRDARFPHGYWIVPGGIVGVILWLQVFHLLGRMLG